MPSDERAAEEGALISQAQHGDKAAMEALLQRHRPLLCAIAGRIEYASKEELVQAGSLGLMQAILRYDASRNTKLATYAVPWILGEMKRALRSVQMGCISLEEPRGEESLPLSEILAGSCGVDVEQIDLRIAMQNLPHEAQTLICLRYFRDKTQAEAAHLLHRSQAQVSRMERRALDMLHAWLTE